MMVVDIVSVLWCIVVDGGGCRKKVIVYVVLGFISAAGVSPNVEQTLTQNEQPVSLHALTVSHFSRSH